MEQALWHRAWVEAESTVPWCSRVDPRYHNERGSPSDVTMKKFRRWMIGDYDFRALPEQAGDLWTKPRS